MKQLEDLQLFAKWREVMEEMRRRGLIRSTNRPVIGDYAEVLVARALDAQRPPGPDTGVDLVTPDNIGVQVKARRDPAGGRATHFDITHLKERRFESFVGVVFREDFTVRSAWQMGWHLVDELATESGRKHRLRISEIERAAVQGLGAEAIELKISR